MVRNIGLKKISIPTCFVTKFSEAATQICSRKNKRFKNFEKPFKNG